MDWQKENEKINNFLGDNPEIAAAVARRMVASFEAARTINRVRYYFENCTNSGELDQIAFDVRMFGL